MATDQAPIASLEAEMSVLGAAVLRRPAQTWLAKNVPANAFYYPANQILASILAELEAEDTPADILTLKNRVVQKGVLREVGGEEYIIQICEAVPSAANAEHYGRIVLEAYGKRVLRKRIRDFDDNLASRPLSELLAAAPKLTKMLRDPGKGSGPSLPGLITFNGTFQPVEIEYLVEPYFPKGKTILVDADGGTGKSSWLLSVAADLSNGRTRFGTYKGEPVRTLYLFADADRPEEYETVFRANEGREGYITYYNEPRRLTKDFADEVIETVKAGGYGMVVFDPFMYFLHGLMESTNDALQALPACSEMSRIASSTGASVVAVRHTSKGDIGKKASELGMGSVQFRNSFRGQLVMRWHPQSAECPEYRGVVVVTDEKGSILVPRGDIFSFRREGLQVQYIVSSGNPFHKGDDRHGSRGPTPEKTAECMKWLAGYLGASYRFIGETIAAGIDSGFSKGTIYKAAERLGVTKAGEPGRLTWSLPYDPFSDTDERETQRLYRGGD